MKKWLLIAAGLLFVALGAVGVVLPGLPTTPFLLLAAGCFAKSSPRLHGWLLGNPIFGPLIENWQAHRAIPRRAKRIALLTLVLVAGSSLYLIQGLALKLLVAGLLIVPVTILIRLRTVEELALDPEAASCGRPFRP